MTDTSMEIAVELPASCDKHCTFCRFDQHGVGNPDAVKAAVKKILDEKDQWVKQIYIVSNGEPGNAGQLFTDIIADGNTRGIPVAVACADPVSVVPGLVRVEVSATLFTMKSSREAILKALGLDIPVIVTLIDDGKTDIIKRLEKLQTEFSGKLAGHLIRALQAEWRSKTTCGTTSFELYDPKRPIGIFPVSAYQELCDFPGEHQTVCINAHGQEVPFLGGYIDADKK